MLQKPFNISLKGVTIDANEDNVVTWQVSGDIQTSYKIDILSNEDNSLVWTSGQISSYALKHTILSGTLTNGNEYKIIVQVWSQSEDTQISDTEIFQTSSRPVVIVNKIGTVNSYSYNFSATYSQSENVALRNYYVNLYNSDKVLIDNSNIKTILPMEHLFSNLKTEETYYVEFIATSAKGLTATSGLIQFEVSYYQPKMNVFLKAKNIENAGIELSWYVKQIIGDTNGSQFIDNEKIDTTDGTKIWFNDGFDIDKNFTLKLWIEQPYMSNIAKQVDLIKLYGNNGTIYLQYWDDHRFHLWKDINDLKSHWFSEEVIGDSYFVFIQQINDDMNIKSELNI